VQSATLEVQDVAFSYPKSERAALDGVSFSAVAGEVVGVIGANGAGKTTLTKLITGCVPPLRGVVRIAGTNVMELRRREFLCDTVGTVQQELSFEVNVSVQRNLEIYARLLGIGKEDAKRRIQEVLTLFRLHESRKKEVSDLSVGNRKRLQVAREFLRSRPLMILDEPTAGLDPLIRKTILDWLKRSTRSEQMLVLYTSHYLGEIEAIADKLLVLDKGKVRFWGVPQDFMRLVPDRLKVVVTFPAGIPERFSLAHFGRQELNPPNSLSLYTQNHARNIASVAEELANRDPSATMSIEPLTLEEVFLEISTSMS
jgi:ABC-2 type transport system ATP-binding protein